MEVAAALSDAGKKSLSSRYSPVDKQNGCLFAVVATEQRGSKTAEILQLPRNDNDKGVWTLLTQQMTQGFSWTFLVNFNNRIVAVSEQLFN